MITATVEKGKTGPVLRIEIDMEPPHPSGSGKTVVVASTHGNVVTTATARYQGALYPITIGVNAFIRPPRKDDT